VRLFTWEIPSPGVAEADASLPFGVHRQPLEKRGSKLDPQGVAGALAEWGSEVAFVSGGSSAVSRIVHTAARLVPTVVAVHDLRDKGRNHGRFGRWRVRRRYGYDRVARITANSDHTCERLFRLGVPRELVSIVHPGVDVTRFVPDPESGARKRAELGLSNAAILMTISRLAPNKGHLRVIEALPRLRKSHPDLVYLIVGSGVTLPDLEARVAELGVGDMVRFVGRVQDVRPYYNACDVFVMVSRRHGGGAKAGEGFGIAYVEAGACGKPVVASSSGGGNEIVVDGETGRVVDPDHPERLEAALHELLTDRDLSRALGEKAHERVQRYDWSNGAAELDRVLREAAPG
jgi:phosphatidylinositol alpha-1,6-mannosyltransferase